VLDEADDMQRDLRNAKILSLRPKTNFEKFDNSAVEDLKERTGLFSDEREPR
jgi:hypothetical protein